ncbi:hypothetical protein DZF91_13300 [Actinomadura logoneensis]|uniref:Uncharacterized protein n=1 Tax=Actinomadura logoneensis TaxID=2293572 RepID=A0A372JMK0_9ACTN|nr:hypothetical protein [Actinomadura logoneensis]RFU41180.1 hypothetical protein DZF91_13300 [Actinomadura logoneensis]
MAVRPDPEVDAAFPASSQAAAVALNSDTAAASDVSGAGAVKAADGAGSGAGAGPDRGGEVSGLSTGAVARAHETPAAHRARDTHDNPEDGAACAIASEDGAGCAAAREADCGPLIWLASSATDAVDAALSADTTNVSPAALGAGSTLMTCEVSIENPSPVRKS